MARNNGATRGKRRATVRDYTRLAASAFQRRARGALTAIGARGQYEDWQQEIALAAWRAEQAGMTALQALRFFGREAHGALRALGFAQSRTWSGYLYRA